MAQEKKGLKTESKQPLFGTGDLAPLDGLDVATFDSSYHDWPTSSSQYGLNPFEEQPLYRGFQPEEGHNLNTQTFRGFHPEDSYSSGTDFIDNGGFPVIGNDNMSFPVFKAPQPSKSSAISTKSLSSAMAEPRVEPPSPPGGYMEASFHMMSSGNPSALMQACLTHLAQSQIDCVPKHDQFKIKCQSFRSCARVSFTVFIWLVSAEANQKRYAVEFQRRSGCCMQFADIYRSAKRHLSEQRLIDKVKASSVKEAPSAPPLEIQITVDQVRDTVKSLMNMATNKCVEMKAQGMLALAELTSSDSNVQKMMVEEGVADAMIDELNSEVVDVHRGALSGIANLAHEREAMCTAMMDKGAVKTVQQLARSQHMQVVREAARLLSILGTTLGTKVVDTQFKSTLQFLRGSKDSKAREHVSSLLELLNM